MKTLMVGAFALLVANAAFAQPVGLAQVVPMDDAGLFALAAACLGVGIGIVRRKRK